MEKLIKEGDIVNVFFASNNNLFNVKVVSYPKEKDETWIFEDRYKQVYEVKNYEYIQTVINSENFF